MLHRFGISIKLWFRAQNHYSYKNKNFRNFLVSPVDFYTKKGAHNNKKTLEIDMSKTKVIRRYFPNYHKTTYVLHIICRKTESFRKYNEVLVARPNQTMGLIKT